MSGSGVGDESTRELTSSTRPRALRRASPPPLNYTSRHHTSNSSFPPPPTMASWIWAASPFDLLVGEHDMLSWSAARLMAADLSARSLPSGGGRQGNVGQPADRHRGHRDLARDRRPDQSKGSLAQGCSDLSEAQGRRQEPKRPEALVRRESRDPPNRAPSPQSCLPCLPPSAGAYCSRASSLETNRLISL